MKYVSNIFPITNLAALNAAYCLFEIKGLRKNKDYQANKQFLIDKFSRTLRHPVTIIELGDEPRLVVKNDPAVLAKIEREHDFGRIYIHLNLLPDPLPIDFVNPSPEVKQICLRFLQFDLNGELRKNWNLWQPYTGGPFFSKNPQFEDGIAIFKGFTSRVIDLPKGGFGIIIDAARKFSRAEPLPHYLKKHDFYKHYHKKSFIYHYQSWYEIQPQEFDDFNVSQFKVNGLPLIDFIRKEIPKPHPDHLANLPADSAVLTYYTNNGETRGAPAGLLYEVLDFQDTQNPDVNRKVLIPPQERFYEILGYREEFFSRLKFGNTILQVSEKALELPRQQPLAFPTIELGNKEILRPEDCTDARHFARERMNKLLNKSIGFYSQGPLGDHIFVLPRSINDTSGTVFMQDLKESVDEMYPSDTYTPTVISYEDKFKYGTDYVSIGNHIVNAVKEKYQGKGKAFGVVMIPRLEKKAKREHDKLAALIIRKLRNLDLVVSIIHTDMVLQSFQWYRNNSTGEVVYSIKPKKQKRYNGYIRNIAINKVLLNCNKWPFVLHKPLNADLVVGIDVKHHTAGFAIVDKHGKSIRPVLDETNNKERLSESQLKSLFYQIIKEEYAIDPEANLRDILLIRDGRLFETELAGLLDAMKKLKAEGILKAEAGLSIVEIPKTSFLSVRLFSVDRDPRSGKTVIDNVPNGLQYFLNDEAFICTTGREFIRGGTCNPLYVKFTLCQLSQEQMLEDVFNLTALAFTKPDDCSRVPMPIKMNDIRLSNAASQYDEDSYKAVQILLEDLNIQTNE